VTIQWATRRLVSTVCYGAMTEPSFWKRVVLMPVQPGLWTAASGWRIGEVLLPLVTLAVILCAALSGWRAWQIHRDADRWIAGYDSTLPAVTVENGRLRVERDEVIRVVEDGRTFLVDPRETVPLESITTPEYIVVREREVLRKRGLRTEVFQLADLQQVLPDPLRVDGESLRALDSRWGLVLQALLWLALLLFLLLGESLGALAYSVIAAGFTQQAIKARGGELRYTQCLQVALAAYSSLVVLGFALNLLGTSPGLCFGVCLWLALLSGLTLWRARPAVQGGDPPHMGRALGPPGKGGVRSWV
jgi:Protein of unknown function (DUF1189)